MVHKWEAARQRALLCKPISIGEGIYLRASQIFVALTQEPPFLYNFQPDTPLKLSFGKRWGCCFHCKKINTEGILLPVCQEIPCVLSFNKMDHWDRNNAMGHYFSDALILYHTDLSKLKSRL